MSWIRFKLALDVAASAAVILTCALVALTVVHGTVALPGRPPVRAQAGVPPEPPLPRDPVSLQGASTRGSDGAKLALIEFSDFQCPYCGKFARDVLPVLDTKYIETGTLLFAFRQFPLTTIHKFAEQAAEAALCAGQQGRFWQMHDLLFKDQRLFSDKGLWDSVAPDTGLDEARFRGCLGGQSRADVQRDSAVGTALSIVGTPTFFLGRIHADHRVEVTRRFSGALPAVQFEAAIDNLETAAK